MVVKSTNSLLRFSTIYMLYVLNRAASGNCALIQTRQVVSQHRIHYGEALLTCITSKNKLIARLPRPMGTYRSLSSLKVFGGRSGADLRDALGAVHGGQLGSRRCLVAGCMCTNKNCDAFLVRYEDRLRSRDCLS
jgi:hypothetical protein